MREEYPGKYATFLQGAQAILFYRNLTDGAKVTSFCIHFQYHMFKTIVIFDSILNSDAVKKKEKI